MKSLSLSRSWIDEKFVRHYNGGSKFAELGISKPKDPTWDAACKQADSALGKNAEERQLLVTCLVPSDDENSMISEEASTPKITRKSKSGNNKGPQPKRRRILSCGSDNEVDEYKPEEDISAMDVDESSEEEEASLVEEEDEEIEEEEVEDSPGKGKKRKRPSAAASTKSSKGKLEKSLASFSCDSPSVSLSTKKKLSDFSCKDADGMVCGSQDEGRNFSHLSLDWLKPDKIKDAQGRRPDDPDYDSRTLFVPTSFKQGLTPAMVNFYCNHIHILDHVLIFPFFCVKQRQWWELKSKHFDVVLFFKMGKFYELYHMDALMAVKELGIILMKGDHAHCGFPERGFSKYSALLIERGYVRKEIFFFLLHLPSFDLIYLLFFRLAESGPSRTDGDSRHDGGSRQKDSSGDQV